MDPNAILTELRPIVAAVNALRTKDARLVSQGDVMRACELFHQLDEHLTNGGCPPLDWTDAWYNMDGTKGNAR